MHPRLLQCLLLTLLCACGGVVSPNGSGGVNTPRPIDTTPGGDLRVLGSSDAALQPGTRYRTPADFAPGVTLSVGDGDWVGLARPGKAAIELRREQGGAVLGRIEVVAAAVTAGDAVDTVRRARNASFDQPVDTTVGGHAAVRIDATALGGDIAFDGPGSLAGYSAKSKVRVYVVGVGRSSVTAVVAAGGMPFQRFLADAEAVIGSILFD